MGRNEVERFALYGEASGNIAPEFIHIERIVDRSSLYDWSIEPHVHPAMLQVLLLEQGEMILYEASGTSGLSGPCLVLVPQACAHGFLFTPGADGWVLSLAADLLHDPRVAGLIATLNIVEGEPRCFPVPEQSRKQRRLPWLLADLALRLGEERQGETAILAELALLLCEVQMLDQTARTRSPDRKDELSHRFRALVESHYRQHWSVADYARTLGTTRATLTRACRAAFGRGPAEMVHDRLALEAMRYLRFTAAGVWQVSDCLGFTDPTYFARFFRKRTGRTASAFRREHGWVAAKERLNGKREADRRVS